MVYIFGKDTWPYTEAARDDYERRHVAFEFVNVKKDKAGLARMLEHTLGDRRVPVIVDDNGSVTIGFGGTWGVWPAARRAAWCNLASNTGVYP